MLQTKEGRNKTYFGNSGENLAKGKEVKKALPGKQGRKEKYNVYKLNNVKVAQNQPSCQDAFLDYPDRQRQKARLKELVATAHRCDILSAREAEAIFEMAGKEAV